MAKVLVINPFGRRKKRKKSRRRARRASPRRHRKLASNPLPKRRRRHKRRAGSRRLRRNPFNRASIGGATSILAPAGIGALAAVGAGILITKYGTSLPVTLQSGYGLAALQAGLALAVAIGLPKVGVSKKIAYAAGAGIATIAVYNVANALVIAHMPSLAGPVAAAAVASSGVSGFGANFTLADPTQVGGGVGRLPGFGERIGFGERLSGSNPAGYDNMQTGMYG